MKRARIKLYKSTRLGSITIRYITYINDDDASFSTKQILCFRGKFCVSSRFTPVRLFKFQTKIPTDISDRNPESSSSLYRCVRVVWRKCHLERLLVSHLSSLSDDGGKQELFMSHQLLTLYRTTSTGSDCLWLSLSLNTTAPHKRFGSPRPAFISLLIKPLSRQHAYRSFSCCPCGLFDSFCSSTNSSCSFHCFVGSRHNCYDQRITWGHRCWNDGL